MATSHEHYKAAVTKRDMILKGRINETLVMAWASVARSCAKAESAFRREHEGRTFGTWHNSQLDNIDRIGWYARAQVETLARGEGR